MHKGCLKSNETSSRILVWKKQSDKTIVFQVLPNVSENRCGVVPSCWEDTATTKLAPKRAMIQALACPHVEDFEQVNNNNSSSSKQEEEDEEEEE